MDILVKSSADVTAHSGGLFGQDLVLDISQSNGSHETIEVDQQWHAYQAATAGHLIG